MVPSVQMSSDHHCQEGHLLPSALTYNLCNVIYRVFCSDKLESFRYKGCSEKMTMLSLIGYFMYIYQTMILIN